MRRAARIDSTHAPIVRGLRACGYSVAVLTPRDANDAGLPDLLVGGRGLAFLLEVKRPGQKPSAAQLDWHARWRGPRVAVVRSVEDALRAVGAL